MANLEEEQDEYRRRVLEEISDTFSGEDPVAERCRPRIFVSRSNGRGRKPRPPREVGLLVVDGKNAFQIKNGEIKPRIKTTYLSQPDQIANEILTDLPEGERTTDALLARVLRLLGRR